MFRRRPHTVLLATFDSVARIDLRAGRSPSVLRSARRDRPQQAALGDAVRLAVALGPAPAGPVYVLTDELWSGEVSLPPEVAAALAPWQIEQALVLEAEQLSGIPAFESRAGYTKLAAIAGQDAWRVVQADTAQIAELTAAVPGGEGRLAAVAAISPSSGEFSAPEEPGLATADGSAALAAEWLRGYTLDRQSVAVIQLSSDTGRTVRRQRAAGAFAAAVLAICGGLHWHSHARLASAQQALSGVETRERLAREQLARLDELAQFDRDAEEKRRSVEQARAEEVQALRREQAAEDTLRRRPLQLLSALASTAAAGHWVQDVDLNRERAVISGLAIDGGAVTSLAEGLEHELSPLGWSVRSAALAPAGQSQLVRFEMMLVPTDQASRSAVIAVRGASNAK